jgi:hypothetical protein
MQSFPRQPFFQGDLLHFFLYMYEIQHWLICRPSDFSVSEDAGIEPRIVATTALTDRHSNHSARSHLSARSHPLSARSHPHSAWTHPPTIERMTTVTFLHDNDNWEVDKSCNSFHSNNWKITTFTTIPMISVTIGRLTGVASYSTLIFWRMTAVTALSYNSWGDVTLQKRGWQQWHAIDERMGWQLCHSEDENPVMLQMRGWQSCHATDERMTILSCYRWEDDNCVMLQMRGWQECPPTDKRMKTV